MKLTICQCCQIFLLLTAFYFLSSLETVGLLVINVASNTTIPPDTRIATKNSSSAAASTTKQAPNFLSVSAETILTKSPKSSSSRKTLKRTTSATAVTSASYPAFPQDIFSSNIHSDFAGAFYAPITALKPSATLRRLKKSNIYLEQEAVKSTVKRSKQSNAKAVQQLEPRVGVLLPSKVLNRMQVQQGFHKFVEFFQVDMKNVSVDFLPCDDLSGFIKLLEHPKYTTIVRTLNVGSNVDDDLVEGVPTEGGTTTSGYHIAGKKQKHDDGDDVSSVNDAVDVDVMSDEQRQQRVADIGFCHLVQELSQEYNKSVLLWPCNNMKESSNFLPSFEAISYAVKSIATKLNWTQVQIFVGDQNWGLSLAIAANLHKPYTIQIGNKLRDLHAQDQIGKAIIITADMNDITTLRLLRQLESLQHTKVLLIDMLATSFNAQNRFYKNLARIKTTSRLMSNLLLLTVLSDKYRHFLKVAFEDNGIEMVQNFRQQRRLHAMSNEAVAAGVVEGVNKHHAAAAAADWPMHLDSSFVAQEFQQSNVTQQGMLSTALQQLNECKLPLQRRKHLNLNEACKNMAAIVVNCSKEGESKLRMTLTKLCIPHASSQDTNQQNATTQQRIADLRNFIDFFNFYDFLIANIRLQTQYSGASGATAAPLNANRAKYDFIVLDVVRGGGVSATSVSSAINNATGNTASYSFFMHTYGNSGDHNNSNNGNSNENQHNSNDNNGHKNKAVSSSGNNDNSRHSNNTESSNKADNNEAFKWRPLLILEQHEINLNTYITHSILPGYDDWLLVSTVQLTQCGAICWTIVAIGVGVLLIIVAASVAAGIAMRNYFLRKRLSKGPNKIVLSPSDFVFPVDSRRVDEGIEAMLCCWLQQLQEFGGPEVDKPDLLKGSIGSLKNLGLVIPGSTVPSAANGKNISGSGTLVRHNPALLDMRARYNGDLVQLKEVHLPSSVELKSKAMDLLVMAHGLRHENINPLIGWLSDPNRTAMVFDYCSRGSLQDVLIMDEIKLDWSFRLSLLTDLVRGMRYLHTSPLRVHGALSSRNCVVDARWVLKITDYGLASFYEAQGLAQLPRTAKELLWTAPELLRSMKSHNQHHGGRVVGTQMGDVYSFGIIMQEVVVRGEPYCMLSLSAEEIIAKIKKPPPLIRPSVSKGAAPPEAINIMRQCWAEQPDMRPDFNSVYERFKMLNHGRKVNFVDTMFQMLEKYSNNLEELIRERTEQLDMERKKTEQLLNRMLPSSVAEKLKMGLAVDPEEFSDVTIYFSDIVGFTTIAAHCSPVQVVDLLNDLYTIFDATINAYNVYKVETIGDAYMVVSGLPVKIPDHAEQIATMALDLLHQSGRFNVKHLPGVPLQLRIGLHTGPCCAGVVGLTMPRYCLFGDTVNTASRMESTGSSWRIHMSQETRDRLEARGSYTIEPRGLIDIKGKGMMSTFWLLGKKGFDKPLPAPPPIGLDESLIRNSITLKAQANKSRTSTNPSSSQSSSLAGESVEVKVEITPPTNADVNSSNLPNSYSLDSNSTNTISPNLTLCPDFPSKTPSASPQSRKFSELTPDSLLNPNSFNRLPNSAGGSSSRLYKKIEELMDLSSPYNHYKCLSPSESNLTQFSEGKYMYSGISSARAAGSTSSGGDATTGGIHHHSSSAKFDKPGSSRLLRRQFSLDRDDSHSHSRNEAHHQHQIHQSSLQSSHILSHGIKSTTLDIPTHHDTSRSPKISLTRMVQKQNSNSIAQDLEKIEEIPLSPASSQHHSSLDSNMNRSPPSTVETHSPPPPAFTMLTPRRTLYSPRTSAPASPAVMSRCSNGLYGSLSPSPPPPRTAELRTSIDADTESSATVDVTDEGSVTTATDQNISPRSTVDRETGNNQLKKPELTLNVESLMSR